MLSEKELIETCKRLIEQKFEFPLGELWKQRDFEYLSDLILQKTETRISISTLKRIWKDTETRIPHVHTLNALSRFTGFKSWSDFKQKHSFAEVEVEKPKSKLKKGINFSRRVYLAIIPIILMCLFLLFYFIQPLSYNETDIIFKSRKNVASGVPNTVVFEYDISNINFDSAFIQHSWDKRMRAKVNKDNHFQTFIYYYPGYHVASLIINNKILKKEKVNITTLGWESMVDGLSYDGLPQYIATDDIFDSSRLYVSKETLKKNDIPVGNKPFWINYFNVGDFKEAYGENFTLETRLKNNIAEGALVCQYTQLSVICENGMISIPFANAGCIANIHLHISEIIKTGRKNDLGAFGIDLSCWRNIKIKTINKNVEVYVDDKKIYQVLFNEELGRITGFHYKFYGCGAIDMVTLYNAKIQQCFFDEFSKPGLQSTKF